MLSPREQMFILGRPRLRLRKHQRQLALLHRRQPQPAGAGELGLTALEHRQLALMRVARTATTPETLSA